jgi:endonuclease-3
VERQLSASQFGTVACGLADATSVLTAGARRRSLSCVESIEQKRLRAKRIIARLKKRHPDARLALILAAQARDEQVNSVTVKLFEQYRTAADWAREDAGELQERLRSINFYRNKTRLVQRACRAVVENFGGQVPADLDQLLSLPGVGRKTANIILGNAYDQPAIEVDTHVMRLSQRLGFTRRDDPEKTEADLGRIIPKKDQVRFCHLLQYLGREVCQAKQLGCSRCTLKRLCPYPHKPEAA